MKLPNPMAPKRFHSKTDKLNLVRAAPPSGPIPAMKHDRSHRRLVIAAALASMLGLGLFASEPPVRPQITGLSPFVIYFDDGPFPTAVSIRDNAPFVELAGLIGRMGLPYTDATAASSFTIRGPLGTLVARSEENMVTVDGRALVLARAPFRDDGAWYVPVEFLTTGLEQITGVDFRYETGAPRIIAGTLTASRLAISAVENQGETRLTIRSDVRMNIRVQQVPAENRVVLAIDHAPINPNTESLNYRDGSIRSVRFDDSDGNSKILVATTPQVASVRLTPTEENRTFFVDFVPESAPTETVAPRPVPDRERLAAAGDIRVIVVDPGHGGLDVGTQATGTLEKDLTLALARRLRDRLQAGLDATVILTRDSDIELSGETRAAIANNNRADLMISLHIGFSSDPSETGGSLFVMKAMSRPGIETTSNSDGSDNAASEDTLFKPWYSTYQFHLARSHTMGAIVQRRLAAAVPGWAFQLREAPIGVLTAASMPALLMELGNANNATNMQALTSAAMQDRIIEAIVGSVTEFGAMGAMDAIR